MKKIHLFDCDGVILNSNEIKNDAFLKIAEEINHFNPIGYYNWCSMNNGISRQIKLKKLIDSMDSSLLDLSVLIERYSELVLDKLLNCEITPKLDVIKDIDQNNGISWGMISGGNQDEIISVLTKKGVGNYFDFGIYGNPKNKFEIFEDNFKAYKNEFNFTYFGDSEYDYNFAEKMELNFVFVSDWSASIDFFRNKSSVSKVRKLHNYWGLN